MLGDRRPGRLVPRWGCLLAWPYGWRWRFTLPVSNYMLVQPITLLMVQITDSLSQLNFTLKEAERLRKVSYERRIEAGLEKVQETTKADSDSQQVLMRS